MSNLEATIRRLVLEGNDHNEPKLIWHDIQDHDWDAYYAALTEANNKAYEPMPDLAEFELETRRIIPKEDVSEGPHEFFDLLDSSGEHGVIIEGIGTAFFVDRYGGEGQGDEYWYVFKLVNEDEYPHYFMVSGYYASYEGVEYDSVYEVKPKQVMKTEWSKK